MIGLTLGNRYLIEENVGIGGMAVVYRAKDTLLNRNVAVKVLKNEFMDDDEFVKKFAMEAQSAASLSHQNIVSVYDVGSSTIEDVKYNYIVMEYIDGKTLKEVIEEEGPLDTERIVNIGVQIASALEAAHKNNVVHRDIKPHNILINKEGVAKVTDFGIARISSSATITYTSTVLGTVHYISPEQAKGKFIDEKSDLYSLGVVLYEMATGKIPFDAENAVGIALKHIQDPLVEPKSINKEIPDGLNNIIIKAMEKNPSDRFKNATEFKVALLNYRNFRLDNNNEGMTERIGVIKDEDIEERRNKAVYNMPKEEEEEEEEEEKKGIFKTYILPILLAVLVLVAGILIFSVFFKDDGMVKVPALTEMSYEKAKTTLEEMELEIKVENESEIKDLENAKVSEQNPDAATEVEKGTEVTVKLVSTNEKKVIPSLRDKLASEAERILRDLDFNVDTKEVSDDEIEEGRVIGTNPQEGEEVEVKSTITLYVSTGSEEDEEIKVPNVVGFSESKATELLEDSELRVNVANENSSQVRKGNVIRQNPSAGDSISKGSTVTITVSSGPEETKPTEKPTEDESSTASTSVKIDTNYIKQGEYSLKIILTSGGDESVQSNKKYNTSSGNFDVTIRGNKGDTYEVLINNETYATGTLK